MTRVIKSRRAGLSRDQARQQPLYARLLGLQYLAPSGFLCFVFFEGAVALGVLMALAELVSWWGVLVLPVTVAAMVKLNDVVAGALTHPTGAAARSRAPRDVSRRGAAAPESAAPRFDAPRFDAPRFDAPRFDEAQFDEAQFDATQFDATQLGVAQVDTAEVGAIQFEAAQFEAAPFEADRSMPAAAAPTLRRAAVRSPGLPPADLVPPVGPFTPTGTAPAAGPDPSQAVQWWGAQREQDDPAPGTVDYRSWRPGSWTPDRQFAESRLSATRTRPATPPVDVTASGALNEPPAARRWPAGGESLDDPEQWARQAASRRYD